MSDHKFKNFAVLTLDIHAVEVRESKKGGQYAVAQATLPMGESERSEGTPMPFRIIVNNGLTRVLKAGTTMTLVGHIGYEEKEGKVVFLFFPYKFEKLEAVDGNAIARNFAQLTLRAGQEADCRHSDAGNLWGRIRMALSMGKDEKGGYKPSLWITVKAFSHEGDETLPQKLAAIPKGSLATISGRLTYEVYKDKGYAGLVASKIGGFDPGVDAPLVEDKEIEEPNFG